MSEKKDVFLSNLDNIMTVRDLKMHFPITRGLLKRTVGTASPSTSSGDRRSGSWASPAPARPPSGTASSAA